jgi:hypothetical protein
VYFACDTEVAGIEVKEESPVGHGTVICFSIYAGPWVNFNLDSDDPAKWQSRVWVDLVPEYRRKIEEMLHAKQQAAAAGAEPGADRSATGWAEAEGEAAAGGGIGETGVGQVQAGLQELSSAGNAAAGNGAARAAVAAEVGVAEAAAADMEAAQPADLSPEVGLESVDTSEPVLEDGLRTVAAAEGLRVLEEGAAKRVVVEDTDKAQADNEASGNREVKKRSRKGRKDSKEAAAAAVNAEIGSIDPVQQQQQQGERAAVTMEATMPAGEASSPPDSSIVSASGPVSKAAKRKGRKAKSETPACRDGFASLLGEGGVQLLKEAEVPLICKQVKGRLVLADMKVKGEQSKQPEGLSVSQFVIDAGDRSHNWQKSLGVDLHALVNAGVQVHQDVLGSPSDIAEMNPAAPVTFMTLKDWLEHFGVEYARAKLGVIHQKNAEMQDLSETQQQQLQELKNVLEALTQGKLKRKETGVSSSDRSGGPGLQAGMTEMEASGGVSSSSSSDTEGDVASSSSLNGSSNGVVSGSEYGSSVKSLEAGNSSSSSNGNGASSSSNENGASSNGNGASSSSSNGSGASSNGSGASSNGNGASNSSTSDYSKGSSTGASGSNGSSHDSKSAILASEDACDPDVPVTSASILEGAVAVAQLDTLVQSDGVITSSSSSSVVGGGGCLPPLTSSTFSNSILGWSEYPAPGKEDVNEGILEAFREFFRDEGALKVWHNYGFDRHVLENMGPEDNKLGCGGFGGDTMHMARLWDASRKYSGGYSLEGLSGEQVGERGSAREGS